MRIRSLDKARGTERSPALAGVKLPEGAVDVDSAAVGRKVVDGDIEGVGVEQLQQSQATLQSTAHDAS